MATFSLTIPNAQAVRVADAFAGTYGYDPAAGETKEEFFRRHLRGYVKDTVINYETRQASLAAQVAAANAAQEINVT